MLTALSSLQTYHAKHQHLPQLRIDFNYLNQNEVDVDITAIQAAMQTLMERLLSRTYVQGYLVIIGQLPDNQLNVRALLYLEKFQYEALVLMAAEAFWENTTNSQGYIVEQDITDNVIENITNGLSLVSLYHSG